MAVDWHTFLPVPSADVCRIGPDARIPTSTADLYEASWGSPPRAMNPRERIHYPTIVAEESWAALLVRSALIRPASWQLGDVGPRMAHAVDVYRALAHLPLLDHERTIGLSLDGDYRLLAIHEMAVGGLHGCALTTRDIVRVPVMVGASKFIMSHNHPSGDPDPSGDDYKMTVHAESAFAALGIQLVDHLVLSRSSGFRSIHTLSKKTDALPTGWMNVDSVVKPVKSEAAALRPYGRLGKYLVRTALIEGEHGARSRPQVSSFEEVVFSPFVQKLRTESEPTLLTLCVDGRNAVTGVHVARGDIHGLDARSVYAVASLVPTHAVILAHNHVSNSVFNDDVRMTRAIARGLEAIGTPLLDSVIITRDQVAVSMRERVSW